MDPTSDAELVVNARAGDVDAFTALVERYRLPALRLAYGIAGDEAEDAVQDAFVNTFRKLDTYRPRAAGRARAGCPLPLATALARAFMGAVRHRIGHRPGGRGRVGDHIPRLISARAHIADVVTAGREPQAVGERILGTFRRPD